MDKRTANGSMNRLIQSQRNTTDNEIGTVYSTTNYDKFKVIGGNRNLSLPHFNRLKKSMSDNYLFTCIIVNERFEVIDGQHRLKAIMELSLPVNYVVCKGYGLQEVHRLNANSKTWSSDDYLAGYCELGYPEYLKYREFKNKYNFGHGECFAMLTGNRHSPKQTVFAMGNFKVKQYSAACKTADWIMLTAPYYKNYKRRSYIYAMITLLQNPNFEITEFIQKLRVQPTALCDCTDVEQYLVLIEEIYNYRRREKVNLRYSN